MTLLRSSASFLTAQVLLVVVGLATSIVLARKLGPDGRGVVALANLTVVLCTVIATLGLGTSYAYLAGRDDHDQRDLVGNAVVMGLVLGLLTMGLLLALSSLLLDSVLRGMSHVQFVATLSSLPFAFVTYFLTNVLIGAGQAARASWIQFYIGIFGASVVIAAVVLGHQRAFGVIIVMAITSAVEAGWVAVIVARDYGISLRRVWRIASAALAYGAKAYVGSIGTQFWARADFLILNYYAGPATLGQYAVATAVAERVWLLDSAVSQVTLHQVIRSSPDQAANLVARTSRNVLLVSGLASIALAIVSPVLVPALFGEEFRPAVLPLVLLLPGVLALGVARPVSSYFFGQLGKPGITSYLSVLTAAVGVAAYLILIPPFGLAGAAIGSSIAYFVPILVYLRLFPSRTGIKARHVLVVNATDLGVYRQLLKRRADDEHRRPG